jgi:hypothetical protein
VTAIIQGESMAESATYDLETLNSYSHKSIQIHGPGREAVDFFNRMNGYRSAAWGCNPDGTQRMVIQFDDGSAVVWVHRYGEFGFTKCPIESETV